MLSDLHLGRMKVNEYFIQLKTNTMRLKSAFAPNGGGGNCIEIPKP